MLVQFSIGNARDGAWSFAEDLSQTAGPAFGQMVVARDKTIAQLGGELVHVQGLMRVTCWLIHLFEWKKPANITALLQGYTKKYFSYAQ